MKRKNYFYILLEIISGFSICYSICIIPFFYLMYPKFFDNFGMEFILNLKGLMAFLIIMLVFSFPVFILLALVRLLINNKISYLINFVLFECYGYFLFGYPDTNYFNGSLLYILQTQYFIYSIPMTVIFLLIVFIIDVNYVGIKLNNRYLKNKNNRGASHEN